MAFTCILGEIKVCNLMTAVSTEVFLSVKWRAFTGTLGNSSIVLGVHIKSECLFLKWVGSKNPEKIFLNCFFLTSLGYLIFELCS